VLLDRNPKTKVAKIDADILTYPGLAAEIAKADVVVLATDNEPSRYTINEICVRESVPFVVGRVFTRGIGGEVFAYRPPDGACLACLEAALQRTPFREGIREIDLVSEEEREKVYGMEIAEIRDSPGLTVDIAFITSFHTRFVLDAIARRLPKPPKFLDPIRLRFTGCMGRSGLAKSRASSFRISASLTGNCRTLRQTSCAARRPTPTLPISAPYHEWIDRLSLRGEQLTFCLARAYIPHLINEPA
jgi:ThiF family